eukprot:GHVQ01016124.1.p1 GENE.GHVQ01016124.1~~GHVQ01016124.1.p1  ORF type:complete len:1204 (-),score=205.50 GHVQ01016124.1:203-3814(-)
MYTACLVCYTEIREMSTSPPTTLNSYYFLNYPLPSTDSLLLDSTSRSIASVSVEFGWNTRETSCQFVLPSDPVFRFNENPVFKSPSDRRVIALNNLPIPHFHLYPTTSPSQTASHPDGGLGAFSPVPNPASSTGSASGTGFDRHLKSDGGAASGGGNNSTATTSDRHWNSGTQGSDCASSPCHNYHINNYYNCSFYSSKTPSFSEEPSANQTDVGTPSSSTAENMCSSISTHRDGCSRCQCNITHKVSQTTYRRSKRAARSFLARRAMSSRIPTEHILPDGDVMEPCGVTRPQNDRRVSADDRGTSYDCDRNGVGCSPTSCSTERSKRRCSTESEIKDTGRENVTERSSVLSEDTENKKVSWVFGSKNFYRSFKLSYYYRYTNIVSSASTSSPTGQLDSDMSCDMPVEDKTSLCSELRVGRSDSFSHVTTMTTTTTVTTVNTDTVVLQDSKQPEEPVLYNSQEAEETFANYCNTQCSLAMCSSAGSDRNLERKDDEMSSRGKTVQYVRQGMTTQIRRSCTLEDLSPSLDSQSDSSTNRVRTGTHADGNARALDSAEQQIGDGLQQVLLYPSVLNPSSLRRDEILRMLYGSQQNDYMKERLSLLVGGACSPNWLHPIARRRRYSVVHRRKARNTIHDEEKSLTADESATPEKESVDIEGLFCPTASQCKRTCDRGREASQNCCNSMGRASSNVSEKSVASCPSRVLPKPFCTNEEHQIQGDGEEEESMQRAEQYNGISEQMTTMSPTREGGEIHGGPPSHVESQNPCTTPTVVMCPSPSSAASPFGVDSVLGHAVGHVGHSNNFSIQQQQPQMMEHSSHNSLSELIRHTTVSHAVPSGSSVPEMQYSYPSTPVYPGSNDPSIDYVMPHKLSTPPSCMSYSDVCNAHAHGMPPTASSTSGPTAGARQCCSSALSCRACPLVTQHRHIPGFTDSSTSSLHYPQRAYACGAAYSIPPPPPPCRTSLESGHRPSSTRDTDARSHEAARLVPSTDPLSVAACSGRRRVRGGTWAAGSQSFVQLGGGRNPLAGRKKICSPQTGFGGSGRHRAESEADSTIVGKQMMDRTSCGGRDMCCVKGGESIKEQQQRPDCDHANCAVPNGNGPHVCRYYKTKICPYFKMGTCMRTGSLCQFAHGLLELRGTPGLYKRDLCAFWLAGRCKAKENCRYAHGFVDLRPSSTAGAAVEGMPSTTETARLHGANEQCQTTY